MEKSKIYDANKLLSTAEDENYFYDQPSCSSDVLAAAFTSTSRQTNSLNRPKLQTKHTVKVPPSFKYTAKQLKLIKTVNEKNDFYDILSISPNADFTDIDKAYRRLCRKLHPDKNSAPGATEAFQKITNARRMLYKSRCCPIKHEDRDSADFCVAADDLFNDAQKACAADGIKKDTDSVFVQSKYFRSKAERRAEEAERLREQRCQKLYYIAYVLIALFVAGMTIVLIRNNEAANKIYRFEPNREFSVQRITKVGCIPYFVKPNFANTYQASVNKIENYIIAEYKALLEDHCRHEKLQQRFLKSQLSLAGNYKALYQLMEAPLKSCEMLQSTLARLRLTTEKLKT